MTRGLSGSVGIGALLMAWSVFACSGEFTSAGSGDAAGDGDASIGDGDASGDGDTSGDGDGDSTGDGYGDTGDGDVGDGDTGDGDTGDGDGAGTGGRTGTGGGPAGTGGMTGMPPMGICPPMPPNIDMMCPQGLSCTYGDDPRLNCRESYTCSSEGQWVAAIPDCLTADYCFDELPYENSTTSCEDFGHTCWYDDHIPVCVCQECVDQECAEKGFYSCVGTGALCPNLPPNLGQACDDLDGVICEYARCPSPDHAVVQCAEGKWQRVDTQCAEAN